MRFLVATAVLFPQLLAFQAISGGQSRAALPSLHDRYRPLLIFSPSDTLPAFLAQSAILTANAPALAERDVVVIPILSTPVTAPTPETPLKYFTLNPLDQADARHQYQIASHSFTVILLGKDGEEKLRAHTAVSFAQLRNLIDAMPMRQREMRDRR